jgi:gliding motility-associated lipoprotein GldD
MKATIYLSYKPVNNNINLLLRDAQKLTYEHVIKADDILEQPFLNKKDKVYGMFYQVMVMPLRMPSFM